MKELSMQAQYNLYMNRLRKWMRVKKLVNALICAAISVLGVLAIIYKAKYEGNFWTCLREMTVDGTLFTTIVSFIYFFINVAEMICNQELEKHFLYYLRLSSAVGEFMILLIVMIGYLPIVPDHPVIARFDMINMHVIIPLLTIFSFVFHDPPIGKLKPPSRWNGLLFIALYAFSIMTCIITGIIPQSKIPYSFMNIYTSPIWYVLFAASFVFLVGYLISWMLSELNRKASWLWYRNVAR